LALYCLQPDGTINWVRQQGPANVPPAITRDGKVVLIDQTNAVRAYDGAGTLLWTTDLPGYSAAAPAIDPAGRIVIATDRGDFNMTSLWMLEPDKGHPLWGCTRWLNGSASTKSDAK